MVNTVTDEVHYRKSSSFDNCISYAFSGVLLKISIDKDTSHNLIKYSSGKHIHTVYAFENNSDQKQLHNTINIHLIV